MCLFSRSLKDIEPTQIEAAYDFSLVIHSNHGPIYETMAISLENRKFSANCTEHPTEGVPLGIF